ncbi:MAG: hypothetical protein C0471_14540 [Erythrobacter sp.]|nr:hypothetical protein [Erythrobacter sp.]
MSVTRTFHANIVVALLAVALSAGCAAVERPKPVTSDDQACERVMSVLAANKTYRADQMAGCDGGKDDNKPGFYVLRVNAHCREPQGCGSVLLGWYAVETSTGAVYDMDVAEWTVGPRIDRNN